MLAYCGLECHTCPIHLATLEQDSSRQKEMRESIAKLCYSQYGMDIKPEDVIDCDGCLTRSGNLFSGCQNCEIRKCAIDKNIKNCAYCNNFVCDKLNELFRLDPEAQIRLERIRQST